MSYRVGVNGTASVSHKVENLAGTGTVSGVAATITSTLYDPTGATSALPVTITEVGTSGFYLAAFTPTSAGIWTLELKNPAGTDEQTSRYTVDAISILVAESTYLTTLDRVHKRLKWDAVDQAEWINDNEDLLTHLISEVSGRMHDKMARFIPETVFTRRYSGKGDTKLLLHEGPLVSVATVQLVEYGDDGAGNRTENLEALGSAYYVEHGLRSEGHRGGAWLERLSGYWPTGTRNIAVTFTAGFENIPETLVHHATNLVVAHFNLAKYHGRSGATESDTDYDFIAPGALDAALTRAVAEYRMHGVA